jgi:Na+-transporting methylmalonyl-CoA/oxaloacetate decarboxylase gamma subunit
MIVNEIVSVFGMGFVGLILVCLVVTVGEYITEDLKLKRKIK